MAIYCVPMFTALSRNAPDPASSVTPTQRWQRFLLQMIRAMTNRIQAVPRPKAIRWSVALGDLACVADRRHREIAHKNLRFIYGDRLTETARRDLVRDVFRHFAFVGVEFLRGPLIRSRTDMDELIVSVGGWDDHVAPYIRQGRGVVIATGHFGNWEFLGRYIVAQGLPLTVVARSPEYPAFAAWAKQMRESAGFSVAAKGESAKKLLSVLKRGDALGLLSDQNSGDLFLPFLGVPAGTPAGAATLAARTNSVLVPCWCWRDKEGGDKYRIAFEPEVPNYDGGDKNADVARSMAEINERLGTMVDAHPAQWLWLHDRWKSVFDEHNRQRLPEGLNYAELRERYV